MFSVKLFFANNFQQLDVNTILVISGKTCLFNAYPSSISCNEESQYIGARSLINFIDFFVYFIHFFSDCAKFFGILAVSKLDDPVFNTLKF